MSLFLMIIVMVLLCLLVFCHLIGTMFLKNLKRKNPGEKFSANIDVSFYKDGPLYPVAQKGLAYMQGLPQEDVYITSFDGIKLHGTMFRCNPTSNRFIIGIHGFQSHAFDEFAPHMAYYESKGFNILLVDDRGHGYSEGKYITMGVKDRLDCVAWATSLVEKYGTHTQILLHGVSMGAATVLAASGEEQLPKQVIGIVADCGYTDVKEALLVQMKALFHVPSRLFVPICSWYASHKAGFSFSEGKPIEQVKKARAPIFIVHGEDDFIVPVSMAYKLYDACQSEKDLLIVKHASHAESIAVNPEDYHKKMENLFDL